MNEYQETLTFLMKMENVFFDYKWKAMAEGDEELFYYSVNEIAKINEMKNYIREQYMN